MVKFVTSTHYNRFQIYYFFSFKKIDYIRERFGISSKLVKIRIREYINYIRTKHWGPEGTETDGNDGTDPESD